MNSHPEAILTAGLRLLRELLEISSPSGQEEKAVHHLVAWLQQHGFTAYRDAVGNAIGILQPADHIQNPRELLLLGHIDTVPGFPPVTERAGRLYGRGAVDAKGPLAAFATAAALAGPQRGWRIVVAGAVEEEAVTSRGARHLITCHQPHLVVIGEPTGWQRVALGYKGRLAASVRCSRPLSHSAGPVATAAEQACTFWQRVQNLVAELNTGRDALWQQVQASLRSFASSNDGLKETAELQLTFRLPADIAPETFEQLVASLDGEMEFRFWGAEYAYLAPKNTPLVRAFLAAIRGHGGTPGFVLKTGTSDMNVVGPAWQCPILAYGPGDSSLDHTPEEHVEIAEWLRGVAVLTDVIQQLTSTQALQPSFGDNGCARPVGELVLTPVQP